MVTEIQMLTLSSNDKNRYICIKTKTVAFPIFIVDYSSNNMVLFNHYFA